MTQRNFFLPSRIFPQFSAISPERNRFAKFLCRKNLIAFFVTILVLLQIFVGELLAQDSKFRVLRTPPIQIPAQNGEKIVLFNKFHRRTNLIWGPVTTIHKFAI
jgi:hypothetical protein